MYNLEIRGLLPEDKAEALDASAFVMGVIIV